MVQILADSIQLQVTKWVFKGIREVDGVARSSRLIHRSRYHIF